VSAMLLLASLPGKLAAQSYTIPVARPVSESGFYTASVSDSIGWEVLVDLDVEHCELHCTYRRKAGAVGIPFAERLPPPVTTIRVYEHGAAKPFTVTIDPAGVTRPAMYQKTNGTEAGFCLPGKRLLASIRTPESCPAALEPRPRNLRGPGIPSAIPFPALPLRI